MALGQRAYPRGAGDGRAVAKLAGKHPEIAPTLMCEPFAQVFDELNPSVAPDLQEHAHATARPRRH